VHEGEGKGIDYEDEDDDEDEKDHIGAKICCSGGKSPLT